MAPIRLGVIGAGSVVREIYQDLYFRSRWSPLLEVAAVADPNEAARNWLADLAGLPASRRFDDYGRMLSSVPLDAVQVNTPDALHCAPTLRALEAGLDVVVAKPAATDVAELHRMAAAASSAGRLLVVDYHKRGDPRILEARARYRAGRYGALQIAWLEMVDRIDVVDPNRTPPFFASPDFAEKNTPVSFLTVHMADALFFVTGLRPVAVRARGFADRLPALEPRPVRGWDLVDTEVVLEGGAVAHIVTGWHLPETAPSLTVQSGRLICVAGTLDLALDRPGLRETHASAFAELNPLFRCHDAAGRVGGYGIEHPGGLYEAIARRRAGAMPAEELQASTAAEALGFGATLVAEAAALSLQGPREAGREVALGEHVRAAIGAAAAARYGYA